MSGFSDEQLQAICEVAEVIACQCPAYLVDLLRLVRRFHRYTQEDCPELVSEVAETHHWLGDQMLQIETSLSQVLTEFMRREQLLNDRQQVDLVKLAQHNLEVALRQQGA